MYHHARLQLKCHPTAEPPLKSFPLHPLGPLRPGLRVGTHLAFTYYLRDQLPTDDTNTAHSTLPTHPEGNTALPYSTEAAQPSRAPWAPMLPHISGETGRLSVLSSKSELRFSTAA